MDPITIGSAIMGGVGIGMQVFGASRQREAARDMAAAQQQMTMLEMQQEGLRQRAMELDARRRSMEVLRNVQRARALALTNANAQGARLGSGLQGGLGQIAAAGAWNLQGINQNVMLGRENFGITQQISNQRILYSQAQSRYQEAGGISQFGGAITSNLGPMSNLAGQFRGRPSSSPFDSTFGGTTGGVGMGMTGGIGSA